MTLQASDEAGPGVLSPETWLCSDCQVGGKEILPTTCWICGRKIGSVASRIIVGAEQRQISPAVFLAGTIAFGDLSLDDIVAGTAWPSSVMTFQKSAILRTESIARRRLAREIRQQHNRTVLPSSLKVSWVPEYMAQIWWKSHQASGPAPWPSRRCILVTLLSL